MFSQSSCDLKQQQEFVGKLLQEVHQVSLDLHGFVYVNDWYLFPYMMFVFLKFRPVMSGPQLIMYLGLNKDPSDPAYSLSQRAALCYVAHAILLILKKAKTSSELGLDSPLTHPTYTYIMPLLSKISIPLVQ